MTEARPSVLLVDDEPRILELLGAVLEHQGFQPALASSPQAGIDLLRTIRFDAVVSDVVFDGFAEGSLVLAAARDLQPQAIILLMTGYPKIEGAVSAIKAGALDYIQKPVDPIVLAAYLHRALKEREIERPNLVFKDLIEILSAMVANTIERVDPYTAGHGARTRVWVEGIAEPIVASRTERAIVAAMGGNPGAESAVLDEALDLAARVADAAEQGRFDVVDLGRRARRLLEATAAEPESLF